MKSFKTTTRMLMYSAAAGIEKQLGDSAKCLAIKRVNGVKCKPSTLFICIEIFAKLNEAKSILS